MGVGGQVAGGVRGLWERRPKGNSEMKERRRQKKGEWGCGGRGGGEEEEGGWWVGGRGQGEGLTVVTLSCVVNKYDDAHRKKMIEIGRASCRERV